MRAATRPVPSPTRPGTAMPTGSSLSPACCIASEPRVGTFRAAPGWSAADWPTSPTVVYTPMYSPSYQEARHARHSSRSGRPSAL